MKSIILSLCLCVSVFAADKPNVIFIAIDDLNDWTGFSGGNPQAQTPHMDALAKQGTVFNHAYCSAPACGPSRTALMYGIYPHKSGSYGHHSIYDPKNLLPSERLPLNLSFQKNGYYTAGCGKIFHYAEKRGWDEYVGNFPGKPAEMTSLGKTRPLSDWRTGIIDTESNSDTPDGKLTDWAIEQLEKDHQKPFFIALGLRKPHLPWVAPKKYFDLYDPEKIQLPPSPKDDLDDVPNTGKAFAHNILGFFKVDDHKAILSHEGAWKKLVHAYLATTTFTDSNVGKIMQALKKSPHKDNTIIVLWGDHGWHLGEKEHWRKMTLWERGTRVPFIIKVPRGKSNGKKIDASVSLQDIYPTLVDLCQLEVEPQLDGNSLRPLLENTDPDWDKPVIMSHGPGNFAVRQGAWRLIHYADATEELYNIIEDPKEFTNLATDPEFAAVVQELRSALPQQWKYLLGPRFKKFSEYFAESPVSNKTKQ